MDFSRFQLITFDCYGTLIDWESGILNAVSCAFPALESCDDEILTAFSEIEPAIQSGEYKSYRLVLRETLVKMGMRFKRKPANAEALADSIKDWKPFSDSFAAVARLKKRCKVGIISNIDDDLFAATAIRLGLEFDFVITAQQVRSYKPSLRNFQVAMERTGFGAERILHVAESLFHDITPAKRLGIANVWVNRRAKGAVAASKWADVEPDLIVPDLNALADLVA